MLGILEELVDQAAHLRCGVLRDALDHIGGHLFHDVHRVVHVEFVDDFFQFIVGKALDEQFLGLRGHLHKRLCRQFLGQQPEEQGELILGHVFKDSGHVHRVHGDQDVPEGGIFFALHQGGQGIPQRHDRSFCHWHLLPAFFVSRRAASSF